MAALEHHGAGTRRIVEDVTARVDAACSRFRPDSELALLPDDGLPVPVSPLLAELVTTGLRAAERTEGDVDPTLGAALVAVGYDRTFALIGDGPVRRVTPVPRSTTCSIPAPAHPRRRRGAR